MITALALSLALGVAVPAAASVPPAGGPEDVRTLKTPTGVLWGTLDRPRQGGPVVLILPGSGPTDRDGNGPSLHTDMYKLLAHGLADRGITTLRIDKRGIGESAPAMSAEKDLRITTYADDARAWIADLKAVTGARCVWLAGHSEGALIAELAAQHNSDVCGVVMISGAGRTAADVLREQLATVPEPPKAALFKALAELEAGRTTDCPTGLESLCRPSVQPYMISWLPLDPATLLKTVPGRVLILQGTTDLQVKIVDAERLAAARPDAKLIKLEGVNHVLRVAPLDRAANLATYGDPALPLAPGVVDAIADFMEAKR
jgi:pimeloyl-ACP methyl ester carboxylesterase